MLVELLVQLIENSCCCSPLHSCNCAVHCTDACIFIAYFIAQSRSKTHAKFIRHLCLHNPSHRVHIARSITQTTQCGLPMQLCKQLYVPSTMQSTCNGQCDGLCGVDWKAVCAVTCIFACTVSDTDNVHRTVHHTVTTRECHPQKQQLKERQLHDQESTILKLLYQYYPRLSCLTYYGSIPNSI